MACYLLPTDRQITIFCPVTVNCLQQEPHIYKKYICKWKIVVRPIVEFAFAERESKNALKKLFLCVYPSQIGGHAPRRSQRRPWKLGIRIVTTFIVCKWVLWWACGLLLAMTECLSHFSSLAKFFLPCKKITLFFPTKQVTFHAYMT